MYNSFSDNNSTEDDDMDAIRGLMEFIDAAPTAFHAAQLAASALEGAGYQKLEEQKTWAIAPGGRYYVTRNRSSVIAFRIPKRGFAPFQISASHGDSPCFKLKPNPEKASQGLAQLNVEKYGGMLMSTWLDRPLSVAGRLIVAGEKGLETRLVNVDRDLAVIPNLPIHFNRSANDGVAFNAQADMLPVIGAEGADVMAAVAEAAGVGKDSVVGSDLFLYNRDRAALVGSEGEFICAPRLDDLACAYTSLRALLDAKPSNHIDVYCLFDNEEVGSGSKQGAGSTLLIEALRRVALALDAKPQALEAALAASFLVSADNAHAAHPNHPEKYDEQNRVRMNGGVVVKSNAAQKYTSDGLSAAVFEGICKRAGVPTQRFANRSDIPGGSTLGNIALSHASMNAVDIGLAQLAMHSARETMGARDVEHMIHALTAFHESEIRIMGDGNLEF